MRRALTLLTWFVLLEGLWELLVGTRQPVEVVAGLVAAALAAAFAELLRSLGLLHFGLDLRTAARGVKLVWQLPVELGVIAWVLLRDGRPRGRWVRVRFPTAARELGRGQRAYATTVGTATPNAIVVDVAEGEALLHSLAPDLPGGHTVL